MTETKTTYPERHILKACNKMSMANTERTRGGKFSITLENTHDTENNKNLPGIVKFEIQSAPIGEIGINGCQAVDMLEYVKCLFQSLNEVFPCRENALTITKIEEAIHWQEARTKDRMNRKVEGKNEK